jgi:hypothetical protein
MPVQQKCLLFTWITLEPQEVIELKQAMLDHDFQGSSDFFWRVVVPRVRDAAQKRGIPLDEPDFPDGCLSG